MASRRGAEFAMGLSPIRNDADWIETARVGNQLDHAYPIRVTGSSMFSLVPESSATLMAPFTPFAMVPTLEADGLAHARLTIGPGREFVRLKATVP